MQQTPKHTAPSGEPSGDTDRQKQNGRVLFPLSYQAALVVVIVIGISSAISLKRTNDQMSEALYQQIVLRGRSIAQQLAQSATAPLVGGDFLFVEEMVRETGESPSVRKVGIITHIELDRGRRGGATSIGNYVAHSDPSRIGTPYKLPEGVDEGDVSTKTLQYRDNSGQRLLRLRESMTYTYEGRNRLVGSVEVIMDLEEIDSTLRQLRLEFARQAALATAVSVVVMILLFRLLLRPMRKLVAAMNRLKEGDFELQVIASDPSEVGLLTRTFNNMALELSQMQKRLVEQERLKRDLEIAETIQQGLLPGSVPDIPRTEVAAFYASASNVGGDYYDIFPAQDGQWALAVADVSGKGISGALGMTMTRSILRSLVKSGLSPSQVLSQCNHTLFEDIPPGMFVTVALAYYHPETGRTVFASAGHNPPLLRHNNAIQEIRQDGLPLGADDEGLFEKVIEETEFQLQVGDTLVMYTDGVTESMDRTGNMFGMERMKETLLHYADAPVKNMIPLLSRKVIEFRKGAEPNDDVTFIVLRRQ